MLITRKTLRKWDACCSDEQIAALIPAEGLMPLQILDLDIPADDRLWVVLREDIIAAGPLRLLAVGWARRALQRERDVGREPDARSWGACDVAERYAAGEATARDLNAARDAAWAAAGDARGAAWVAAVAAGGDADWAAWTAAAAGAATAETTEAARAEQLDDVRNLLK